VRQSNHTTTPPSRGDGGEPIREVVVLLATFNGAEFLGAQLDSVSSQTYPHWRVVAADDGSTDASVEILETFRRDHPGRLEILDGPAVGSAKDNFFRLLRSAPSAPYYAFCDQDDFWHEEKLEVLVAECRRLEESSSPGTPCLVYSDLTVVDTSLRVVADSFWQQIAADPRRSTLGSLLMENHIPGCAMLFNAGLRRVFDEYRGPLDDIIMHDWWVALLAQTFGQVGYVPTPLVQYRQHGGNSMGTVNRRGIRFAIQKLGSDLGVRQSLRQGALFCRVYGDDAEGESADTLRAFQSLSGKRKLARIGLSVRHGLLKQTSLRRIYQLMKI
jgi:glycosyltransferase involved in cell wall biosynthesis